LKTKKKIIRIDFDRIINEHVEELGTTCMPAICTDIMELIEIFMQHGFEVELVTIHNKLLAAHWLKEYDFMQSAPVDISAQGLDCPTSPS